MSTSKRTAESDIYGYRLHVNGDLIALSDTQNGSTAFRLGEDVMNRDALKRAIQQSICQDAYYAAETLLTNLEDDADLFEANGYVIKAASLAGHAEAAAEVKP